MDLKDKTLREQKTLAVCTSTVYALVTLSPPAPLELIFQYRPPPPPH